jgi:hypothetical protein
MVKDGKSIGWNAFTLAGVKSASDFGEMPAAGGVSRRHRTVSPEMPACSPRQRAISTAQLSRSTEILAVSPVHFVDSEVQLLYSAFQLAYSTVQLLVSGSGIVSILKSHFGLESFRLVVKVAPCLNAQART